MPNAPVATLARSRLDRRRFLQTVAEGMAILATQDYASRSVAAAQGTEPRFQTRGIVLVPEDFTLQDWPERAACAGLTTLAVHHQNSPKRVVEFIESETGQAVLARCRRLGLEVEYELHAMRELLPREWFARDTSLFRMDDRGQRVADFNCCVHSAQALELLAENAVRLAGKLRPTTGRYFLWGDDGLPALDRNLTVFPQESAQVLEYWLDVSRFSQWKRPAQRLPWKRDVFVSDLRTYAARGIRHVTTFGAWLDAEYVRSYGEPAFLAEYGRGFWEVAK